MDMKTPRQSVTEGLFIRQVSKIVGVSTSTIRHWEKAGLIKPSRSSSGFRVYSTSEMERLRAIQKLSSKGLNVEGIRHALPEQAATTHAPAEGDPLVGGRIKHMRSVQGKSLRQLAADTGLSASHLSGIERSLSRPSLAILQRLAAALQTNMVNLLGGNEPSSQSVVRPGERVRLDLHLPGIEILQLYKVDTLLESLMFIVEPGADSGESYHHEGEEFLYVLSGAMRMTLDESEEVDLQEGDSLTFASNRPHRFRNNGTEQAVILWVNTPPTF